MGTQQAVRLVVGVLQSKIVAVLLGPSGTGVFGVYASLFNLSQSIFGLGLPGSGVRQIAASKELDEAGTPSQEIRVQLWLGISLGVLAGLAMFLCRGALSRLTFGDMSRTTEIGYIAAATAISLMATGLFTSLQGLRRIQHLTAAHVSGAILSAATAVTLVFWFREHGVAPSFLGASCCVWLTAWIFFRRIRRSVVRPSPRAVVDSVARLIKLGCGFMSASLFAALTAYVVRALIISHHGIETAGLYQAAWMLSTFYCTMVLKAMGTDFFPRISALSGSPDEFNRQINEQTEIGLLIIIPGLMVCMVAAVPILRVLYTGAFTPGAVAARWMIAGMLVRAAGWPLAYVPLALNKPFITVLTEALFSAVLIGLSALGVQLYGLDGAGIAFFATSLVYTLGLLGVAFGFTRFIWSPSCWRMMGYLYPAALAVFGMLFAGGTVWSIAAWTVTLITGACCLARAIRVLMKD